MGTFLKYVFYVIVIVVVYLIGRGIYEGSITEKTTVGQVVSDVGTGSKELVKDGIDATKKSNENLDTRTSAEKARDAGQSAADNAKEASADAWKATKNGAQSAKESVAEGMGNMNAQMNN